MSIYLCGVCNKFHDTIGEMRHCDHKKEEAQPVEEVKPKTNKELLIEEALSLGIELSGEEKVKDLKSLIEAKKAE